MRRKTLDQPLVDGPDLDASCQLLPAESRAAAAHVAAVHNGVYRHDPKPKQLHHLRLPASRHHARLGSTWHASVLARADGDVLLHDPLHATSRPAARLNPCGVNRTDAARYAAVRKSGNHHGPKPEHLRPPRLPASWHHARLGSAWQATVRTRADDDVLLHGSWLHATRPPHSLGLKPCPRCPATLGREGRNNGGRSRPTQPDRVEPRLSRNSFGLEPKWPRQRETDGSALHICVRFHDT